MSFPLGFFYGGFMLYYFGFKSKKEISRDLDVFIRDGYLFLSVLDKNGDVLYIEDVYSFKRFLADMDDVQFEVFCRDYAIRF